MANTDFTILRKELSKAKEWETLMRAKHAMATASVERLRSMIEELEGGLPEEIPSVVTHALPLRFTTTDRQPIYDQASDILAFLVARRDIKQGDTLPLPLGAALPLRTTLLSGGVGEISSASFWMKVGNYNAALGKAGLMGGRVDAKSITKTIKFLVESNPTDEQLEEAYRYYSTKERREMA
jgi:hypothetical protein